MDKYELMGRFHYDHRLQVYMYDFMCVDPETMTEGYYFAATKRLLKTKGESTLQEQYQNIGLDLNTFIRKNMS